MTAVWIAIGIVELLGFVWLFLFARRRFQQIARVRERVGDHEMPPGLISRNIAWRRGHPLAVAVLLLLYTAVFPLSFREAALAPAGGDS